MTGERAIRVTITSDGLEARILIPSGLSAVYVTPFSIETVARQAGVHIAPAVQQAIREAVSAYGTGTTDIDATLARAVEPVRGTNGRIEWAIGVASADQRVATAGAANDVTGRVDHYRGQTYARVTAGQVVGTAIAATPGTDGHDVAGRSLHAAPVKPVAISTDDSLRIDADGRVIALRDGLLRVTASHASISDVLEIAGEVDFSTGHIDFDGDVLIAGGVRPGFKVKAGRSICVDGLVEDSELTCGIELTIATGMAGKGHGSITVGGNADVGYLEGVQGRIEGNLIARREIVDCRLNIGGNLEGSTCSLFGGEVSIGGSCALHSLGSPSFTPTLLRLADVPLAFAHKRQLERDVKRLHTSIQTLTEQERSIRQCPRPRPAERERLTELAFEISELSTQHKAKVIELGTLEQTLESMSRLDIRIAHAVHPHVRVWFKNQRVMFENVVRGPLRIFRDQSGLLLCQLGSTEPKPLSSVATVTIETRHTSVQEPHEAFISLHRFAVRH